MATRVSVNRTAAHAYVMSTTRELAERITAQILIDSKINASTGPYVTGRLASAIHAGFRALPSGYSSTVGTNLYYAEVAEKGAARHIIRARPHGLGGGFFRGGYKLSFYWRKVGHVVTFPYVNHPGHKGKHYIEDALLKAARRHNLRVIIYER